jgi:hypothetical protein
MTLVRFSSQTSTNKVTREIEQHMTVCPFMMIFPFMNVIRMKQQAKRNVSGQSWNPGKVLLTPEFLYHFCRPTVWGFCLARSCYLSTSGFVHYVYTTATEVHTHTQRTVVIRIFQLQKHPSKNEDALF